MLIHIVSIPGWLQIHSCSQGHLRKRWFVEGENAKRPSVHRVDVGPEGPPWIQNVHEDPEGPCGSIVFLKGGNCFRTGAAGLRQQQDVTVAEPLSRGGRMPVYTGVYCGRAVDFFMVAKTWCFMLHQPLPANNSS